ncbi:unnamed protein product [Cyprideis torosa]|uniref:Ubiquitin-protein ligase E3C n=1 Tax=Cyprideis torosa TaxID=163714 RepID=A0A7R8ZHZ9_9CRUS|nr:unnamed protein product [Cyprideis torosa]CAG0878960.1 unnamed protein product [Cyprideis torosa]
MDLEQLPPLNLSLEFMSGLVMLVVEKLNGDLPELTQDGQFAHTLDELLIFDRELHSRFDYPVGEAGPLSVLSQAHFFQRMLDMEKRRTAERIDGFFLSPSAWKPLSVAKDEEYRATECGYNFYQVIQIIEERCHSFLQPGHRLQFVEFILDLLDEFRVRLLQVLKTERDQPLSETAVGILNSTDFFLSMMENWNDLPFYVQMMFFRKQVHGTSESDNEAKEELLEGLFDAQITLYKHVRDDLLSSLVRRVVGELKHQSKSYLSDKWFSMLPHSPLIPASLTASAVGMFACLQNHLCDLNKRLNPSLFKSALRSISSLIEEHLLNDLILDNHFNDGGAAQLKFDVEKNLIPIFGEYSEVPDRGFRQLKEAINLLNLPFGSATLLQDALENPESKATDIDLEEFGVKRLKHHVVSKVLRSRLSLHKNDRLRECSALKISAVLRGWLCRIRTGRELRLRFDTTRHEVKRNPGVLQDPGKLGKIIEALLLMNNRGDNDHERVEWLGQQLVVSHSFVREWMTSSPIWHSRIRRLILISLQNTCTTPGASLRIPLRLLEIYGDSKVTHFLIQHGYFRLLSELFQRVCPDDVLSPAAGSVIDCFLSPLLQSQSERRERGELLWSMWLELTRHHSSSSLGQFLLPRVASSLSSDSVDILVDLVHTWASGLISDPSIRPEDPVTVLSHFLVLTEKRFQANFEATSPPPLLPYLLVLYLLLKAIPVPSPEDMSPPLERLNAVPHVELIRQAVTHGSEENMTIALARVTAEVFRLGGERAVPLNRILFTLAFNGAFLSSLWSYLSSARAQPSPFSPSGAPLMKTLSNGIPLASHLREEFLPPLTLFCALLNQLISTLHDSEVLDPKGSSTMPFSVPSLIRLSSSLIDLCLGLLDLSHPVLQDQTYLTCFHRAAELLRQLHIRDSRKPFCPPSHWLSNRVLLPQSVPTNFWPVGQEEEDSPVALKTSDVRFRVILEEIPFTVPFMDRVLFLQASMENERVESQRDAFIHDVPFINIRRNYIYEDAFEKLSPDNEPNLRKKLRIHMMNAQGLDEAGVDGGGVFREFLSELIQSIFNPNRGLFCATGDNTHYPNPEAPLLFPDFSKHYYFAGRMLGKAIFEGLLIELPLAPFFISKLLGRDGQNVDVLHLETMDPDLYKNLLSLRSMPAEQVEDLGLDFTVTLEQYGANKTVELKSGGASIPVTAENRIEYIHQVADFKLNRQLKYQCQAFASGISNVIPMPYLRLFNPTEFQTLISGARVPIDMSDLRANTVYASGYTADHPVILAFWEIVQAFDETQKRALLKFVTSCSRPPLLGFKELYPAFCIQSAGQEDRLPTASTCMHLLKLPEIRNRVMLKERLLYAIESGAGFELS